MSKYLKDLIQIAQTEMPSLQGDLQNASTVYALQAATQRLFNVVTYLLHDTILNATQDDAKSSAPPQTAPARAPRIAAPAAPVAPVAPPLSLSSPQLPPPSLITQPSAAPAPLAQGMADIPIEPGVVNVVITPQGTRVTTPGGQTASVAPGAHVGLELTSDIPPEPYSEPGVETVVLPPGGGGLPPGILTGKSE